MGFEIDEGKSLVTVYKDGELGIRFEGLRMIFADWYWDMIRWRIDNGFIEEGRLDWEDVTAIVKVMSVMDEEISVPDDIIGEFAKRGYGEFYPDENKGENGEANHSEN